MITLDEYLMGRQKKYPLDTGLMDNAKITVDRVNQLLEAFGKPRGVTSGYRPPEINADTPGASKKSKHMVCAACDLHDGDGELDAFCLAHPEELVRIGLWQEDPSSTPGWCHVQILPPASGHLVFKV